MSTNRMILIALPWVVSLATVTEEASAQETTHPRQVAAARPNALHFGLAPSMFTRLQDESAGAERPRLLEEAVPESRFALSVLYESLEISELETDFEVTDGFQEADATIDLEDTELDQVKLRFRFGGDNAAFRLDLSVGTMKDELGGEFDLFELGFGATGAPSVAGPCFVEYDAGIAVAYGQGETPGLRGSDVAPTVVDVDENVLYGTLSGRLGLGLDYLGIRPSVGVHGAAYLGRFQADDPLVEFRAGGTNLTLEREGFTATTLSFYAGIGFQKDGFPLTARVEALFGDLQGLVASVGVRF